MRAAPLYDPALIARAKSPAGAGMLEAPCRRVVVANASCGDEIELDVRDSAAGVSALAHRVRGCAVVVASASLLVETTTGSALAEASGRITALERWLAGMGDLPVGLAPLAPLRMFPARSRCVLLPWTALARALALAPSDPARWSEGP